MAIWKFGRQNSKNCCWISQWSWSVAPTLGQDENFQKAMAEAMQQAAVGHWVAWVSLLLTVNQLVNRTGATWKLFNQLVIYLAARNQAVAFNQSCDWKVPTKFQPFGAPPYHSRQDPDRGAQACRVEVRESQGCHRHPSYGDGSTMGDDGYQIFRRTFMWGWVKLVEEWGPQNRQQGPRPLFFNGLFVMVAAHRPKMRPAVAEAWRSLWDQNRRRWYWHTVLYCILYVLYRCIKLHNMIW